jgi:hypothetical protein
MQLGDRAPGFGVTTDIASTFSEWVQAHRAYGGDFDEAALTAGIQATTAAYHGGLTLSEAFEMGRQAYYSTLG